MKCLFVCFYVLLPRRAFRYSSLRAPGTAQKPGVSPFLSLLLGACRATGHSKCVCRVCCVTRDTHTSRTESQRNSEGIAGAIPLLTPSCGQANSTMFSFSLNVLDVCESPIPAEIAYCVAANSATRPNANDMGGRVRVTSTSFHANRRRSLTYSCG